MHLRDFRLGIWYIKLVSSLLMHVMYQDCGLYGLHYSQGAMPPATS